MILQSRQQTYHVLGLMSGTSLDGLDVALCSYTRDESVGRWSYHVVKAQTFPYDASTISTLKGMPDASLSAYLQLNISYSKTVACMLQEFLKDVPVKVDFISSHGHTILHQPHNGISLQCCDPTYLAAVTGIDCIGNFRQLDVYSGGQGAPLVPYGAELFPEYSVFLNFGGIVNIDCQGVGWDIGFGNMLSNHYSEKVGFPFDTNGQLGSKGSFNEHVLKVFASQEKLSQVTTGKSFAREDFEELLKNLDGVDAPLQDILCSHYHFLSSLIINHIEQLVRPKFYIKGPMKILCTGGGVYNTFLLKLLKENISNIDFIIPDKQTVEFKQAIVFGFLGVKFARGQQNCSKGVGGSFTRGRPCLKLQQI